MKRYQNSAWAAKCIPPEGRARTLANELRLQGKRALRLRHSSARSLERSLRPCIYAGNADEALRRFRMDAGHIEACLRTAQAEGAVMLPAARGVARILILARALLSGGERQLDLHRILDEIVAFDAVQAMCMQEIQMMPSALNIALCEALAELAERLLGDARARFAAQRWVERDGKGMIPGRNREVFLEHALQLAAETEKPQVHARVERILDDMDLSVRVLLERVHRRSADCCMRLENLMALRRLLQNVDWKECFERISPAEMELRDDPADVYGRMDAPSRAEVRMAAAELAECLGTPEIALVRCALKLAQNALEESDGDDPRSTVCWYFCEDEGRKALQEMLGMHRRLRPRVPDAGGGKTLPLVSGVTAVVLLIAIWAVDQPILALYAPPLAWVFAMNLIGRLYPRWLRPLRLLKLEIGSVPESGRTLVALPVLLSSERRVQEMISHMEALGCLEKDANIDYLLLGDFRDADEACQMEDANILACARRGIARLNEEAGRQKYFYLHRERTFRERDGRWMGRNRKRGALMALNALLLGRAGAANAFTAECADADKLEGKYRFVVTLDADTQYLPGTLQKLIGAMLHPLNRRRDGCKRGYAVLQPAMELTAEACVNAYVATVAGNGGVNGYPVSVSDFYQDMSGRGSFAGKGIYDVRAFSEATDGVLQDDAILSHDLIEGILAGSGLVNDVQFYDGCPENLGAELTRMHRWIRGDWQLLPVLFSKLQIPAMDRMKMVGNLLRSLYAPALAGLLIHAAWLDAPMAFSLGLLLAFHEPLLRLCSSSRRDWRRALFKLAVLPADAASALDAVLRTLWRLAFTRKHLMDWVPAADASGGGRPGRTAGRAAALLMLPALLHVFWIPAVLAIAGLFFVGADWAQDLANAGTDRMQMLDEKNLALLENIARRTWAFFEHCVPEDGCGLPPDNLQVDPPAGAAQRTSPTNIGLYLMSCFAANQMGFVGAEEMLRRMRCSVQTLESLEKWNGQLYNWYDIRNLTPLRPRYVSAVDSGNLAAALLLCAQAVYREDAELSSRMRSLAEDMNLAALYDAKRELFRIGMDVESGRLSEAHYDLYASESRILSYTAMMLGQAPLRHWKHLSRAAVRVGKHQALVSWSGTMFEYLMPELMLRSHENTLAGQSRRAAVACQMEWGKALKRPWGISESGYYAFDMQLNYQYRAFGLRALALSGNAAQDVCAPYAAVLALAVQPAAAAENLRKMCEMGWYGEYGMYEAADYMHLDAERRPRLVRSYMAHHQGMALCALANLLREDAISRSFMEIPQARALRLLLQEKPLMRVRLKRRISDAAVRRVRETPGKDYRRNARREGCAADAHLLHGGDTTALVTAKGAAYVWSGDWLLNRFSRDLQTEHEGMYVHVRDVSQDRCTLFGRSGRGSFDAGSAGFREELCGLKLGMEIFISPEEGILYQQIDVKNPNTEEHTLEITGCMAVVLAPEQDMRAHPVFQNLFVESRCDGDGVLVFRRRPRESGRTLPEMIYLAAGADEIQYETNLEKLVGRTGSLGQPGELAQRLEGSGGYVLNPCAALRMRIRLAGGAQRRLYFALALSAADEVPAKIVKMRSEDAMQRARQLAHGHALAVLNYAGIDARRFRLLQRASALVFDARLRSGVMNASAAFVPMDKTLLWSSGISGDLPILLVEIDAEAQLDCVREGIRMHAFYQAMGVKTDFVVVNRHGSDYRQAARDSLGDLIASSHLNGSAGRPGGVFVLEEQNMDERSLEAIRRAAVFVFRGSDAFESQLRAALDALLQGEHRIYAPMEAERAAVLENLEYFNGFGGFDGDQYCICLREGILPPAPWSNVLASEEAGAVVTERAGGFAWFGNSRSGRLTAFENDVLREGWGWMFYLLDEREGKWSRLLPGDRPMTEFCVHHGPGVSSWSAAASGISFTVEMRAQRQGVGFEIRLRNESKKTRHLRLAGFVDWLMGTDKADLGMLRTWSRFGGCFASGAAKGVGCFLSDDPRVRPGCSRQELFAGGDIMRPQGLDMLERSNGGWTLHLPLILAPGEARCCRFLLGCAADMNAAYALARDFRSGEALRRSSDNWKDRLEQLKIETPDTAVNLLANGFLQAQVLNGRIRARTGLYQPGGAYGFRDQLQDMLPMIHYEPQRVRQHLLYCAARQFEAGDVLHWWHDPYSGVRTHISDDLLFLPYVTARYVQITGDRSVLSEQVPFLQDVEIPEGREDVYQEMQPGLCISSLHEHCMRAFRHAAQTGAHGLCRMGSGDWNDGMNRVGREGRGESIWLSQFLAVCAEDYAGMIGDTDDAAWLRKLSEGMRAAVEAHGWDGKWYLRAYTDEGGTLGGSINESCRIDAISQAWAVLAGLDPQRCASAMDEAWRQLADADIGVIRLLTPPFDGNEFNPGYIAAYPPGVRENGAQYTHAACWILEALIARGDAQRAHKTLKMLLPVNHTADRNAALRYRVEPYVMAADVYTHGEYAGRGGWTWYTGSAAWMLTGILDLLGYERRDNRVCLHALLGDWPEASVCLRWGMSRYRLVCRADAAEIQLDGEKIQGDYVELMDDGRSHTAVFPPRKAE